MREVIRKTLASVAMGLALSVGSPIAGAVTDTGHVEFRRRSAGARQSIGLRRYPRSRKTTTAAQLKRAALRRRNIAKRSKK